MKFQEIVKNSSHHFDSTIIFEIEPEYSWSARLVYACYLAKIKVMEDYLVYLKKGFEKKEKEEKEEIKEENKEIKEEEIEEIKENEIDKKEEIIDKEKVIEGLKNDIKELEKKLEDLIKEEKYDECDTTNNKIEELKAQLKKLEE